MLNIDDIKNVSFRKATFGGYKPEDVDAFVDDVQIAFEKLIYEKEKLLNQINELNLRIKKFYEEDKSIKKVILNAQTIAEKSIDAAHIKTEQLISSAAEQSKQMINDAKKEVLIQNEISDRLKSESANLKKQLEDIYKRHMKIIDEIPSDISKLKEHQEVLFAKKDFKIDSELNKPGSVKVNEAREDSIKSSSIQNIFSSDVSKGTEDKFKNLKFGKNFEDDAKSDGAYFGIFKKR